MKKAEKRRKREKPHPVGARPQPLEAGEGARILRAFFRIADLWDLTGEEGMILLGNPSRGTFYNWKRGEVASLPRDVVERISYVLGIYKALQILFPDPRQADAWVRKKNAAFGGDSAMDRMTAGNVSDLHAVRLYLDHVRGGGS